MLNSLRAILILSLFVSTRSPAQFSGDSISKTYTEKIVGYLAADKLKGRVNYSVEQEQAAAFLVNEFSTIGLQHMEDYPGFMIPFQMPVNVARPTGKLWWNGNLFPDSLYYFFSANEKKKTKDFSDFILIRVDLPVADELLNNNWESKENILFWVKLSPGVSFSQAVKRLELPEERPGADILIVGSNEEPRELRYKGESSSQEPVVFGPPLNNIVGILPGKTRSQEIIIFSAHYDHVDADLMGRTGEIMNGANDDASGVAAVLALAKYFAGRNDNQRTLMFCLFAGEELGLKGSQAFARSVEKENVKAVINIEMIGRTNATGRKAFFITGPESSDLSKIVSKNLKGEKFRVIELVRDPGFLFQRSDNYSFFQKGIPAHSFMCSDDNEPCYHKPCDDTKRIDFDNMIIVIRAIAKGVSTLVSGADTPVLKKM